MKAILFKKEFTNNKINLTYKANSWIIVPDELAKDLKQKFADNPNTLQIRNIAEWFPKYRYPDKNHILFLRTGGIGDLFALSAIFYQLENNITLSTDTRLNACFEWFERRPDTIHEVNTALFKNLTFSNLHTKFRNIRYAFYEGMIENFQKQNWYEIFHEAINLPFDEKFARPILKTNRIAVKNNHQEICEKGSILIIHKASAVMRTVELRQILKAIENSKYYGYKIYVQEQDLRPNERELLEKWHKKINIIKKGSLFQALLNWYDAELVISTDTGAIHFREGVQKKALGIYASFHPDSRNKYYKFTKSEYYRSLCPDQPCYLHENPILKYCKHIKDEKEEFAPCLGRGFNPLLYEDIAESLNEIY